MPQWFYLTIGSVLIVSVAEIAQKVALTTERDISAEANNFIVWLIQGTLALLFVLVVRIPFSVELSGILFLKLAILGSLYFAAGTAYYHSFKHGSASISAILVSLSMIVSTALGIGFFGESTHLMKFVGIALIVGAITFQNVSKGKIKLTKQSIFALIGGGLYGIAFSVDKSFSLSLSPHIYHVFFAFSIAIMSLVFRYKLISRDIPRVDKKSLLTMSVSALAFFGYNKLNFVSYSIGGEVGRIDAINTSAIFFIILLEILILKDRKSLRVKLISATIAIAGVIVLGLLK